MKDYFEAFTNLLTVLRMFISEKYQDFRDTVRTNRKALEKGTVLDDLNETRVEKRVDLDDWDHWRVEDHVLILSKNPNKKS